MSRLPLTARRKALQRAQMSSVVDLSSHRRASLLGGYRLSRGHATDSYRSPKSGIGMSGSDRTYYHEVAPPDVLTPLDLLNLWEGSQIVRRAVGKRAAMALSRGVRLSHDPGGELSAELDRLGALHHGLWGRTWGNLYGGALVLAVVDDGKETSEPVEPGSRVVRLRVVDRHQVRQIHYVKADGRDPIHVLARDAEPESYALHDGKTYHHSRVWRFDGDHLPFEGVRRNNGWHASKVVALNKALARYGVGIAALATQLEDANVAVWKIKDWHQMVTSDPAGVDDWLDAQILYRSVLGDYACDAEKEDFDFKGRPLKDSVEVFGVIMSDLAAQVDMPMTELFGQAPGGLSTDDAGGRKKWYASIDAAERPEFTRYLAWLLRLVQAQPDLSREARAPVARVDWPSLETLSALEEEEVRRGRAEEDAKRIESGVVKASEARRRLRADPTWDLDEEEEVTTGYTPSPNAKPGATDSVYAIHQVGYACDGTTGDGSRVGLFLPLPPELASQRPPLTEDDSAPHVTLLVVGDVRGREEELVGLVRALWEEDPPYTRATLDDLGTLVNRKSQLVVYQGVEVEGGEKEKGSPLHRFRRRLVERLRGRAFPVADVSPDTWLPHVTLDYLPDARATWTGRVLSGSWWVGGVEIWGLGEVVSIGEAREATDEAPDKYSHIDFVPNKRAQAAARRALEERAAKPASERGMTPVGLARARDIAGGKALSPETWRRIKAYLDRHEMDKEGETWEAWGKGRQAWNGWGGDAIRAQAEKIVRQMNKADEKG